MGNRVRCAAAAVAVVALSGCWPQPAAGPSRQRSNGLETSLTTANVASLAPVWSANLGSPVGGEPIVSGTRVFARTMAAVLGPSSSHVVSLDAASGATLWDHDFSPSSGFPDQYNPVTLAGDTLLVGEDTGIFRLDFWTGGTVGIVNAAGNVSAALTVGDGLLVTSTTDAFFSTEQLEVYDAETLTLEWTANISTNFQNIVAIAVGGGRIFVGTGTSLRAFDAAGCGAASCSPLWTVDFTSNQGPLLEPMIVGDTVFAAATLPVPNAPGTGVLVALAADTGAERWRAQTSPNTPGAASAGGVVYANGPNGILAFAAGGCGAATCAPLWSGDVGEAPSAPPVVAGGIVYIGKSGAVVAFDAAGCGAVACPPLVSVPLPGSSPRGLSVASGKLFVSAGSTVTALAPAAG